MRVRNIARRLFSQQLSRAWWCLVVPRGASWCLGAPKDCSAGATDAAPAELTSTEPW
ncbi:hypothetical protein [Hamadaea sp.]|uniref:hypothetical protein n=1 Tax=Hamadaea sp. TaxID=2024425 RepID=UPI0025C3F844|nr:hypothetical protein [Hamadaea sp.]